MQTANKSRNSPFVALISKGEIGNVGTLLDLTLSVSSRLTSKDLDEAKNFSMKQEDDYDQSTNGILLGWGRSDEYQLGETSTNLQLFPKRIPNLTVAIVQVSASQHHTLAVTKDHTLLGWGLNKFGRLGTGDELLRATPTIITLPDEQKTVLQVSTGIDHSVVVTVQGTVFVFGRNNHNQLGMGDESVVTTPREFRHSKRIISCACSSGHTLLLTDDGHILAAGLDDKGQCRAQGGTRGKPLKRFTLISLVQVNNICGIAATEGTSSAWTKQGEGYIWGCSSSLHRVNLRDPTAMVRKVSMSSNVIGVLSTDGRLWTRGTRAELLGHAHSGQDRTARAHLSAFKQIESLQDLVDVSCNERHVGAVDSFGRVFTWGDGDVLGKVTYRPEPFIVEGVRGAVQISSGLSHTLVIVGAQRRRRELNFEQASLVEIAQYQLLESLDVFNVVPRWAGFLRLGMEQAKDLCEGFVRKNLDVFLALNPSHAKYLSQLFPGDPELDENLIPTSRCTSPIYMSRSSSPVFFKASSPIGKPGGKKSPICIGGKKLQSAIEPPQFILVPQETQPAVAAIGSEVLFSPLLKSTGEEKTEEKSKQVEDKVKIIGRCDLCNVTFNNTSSRADHLLGRRHKAAMKRKQDGVPWEQSTRTFVELRHVMTCENNINQPSITSRSSPLPASACWASPLVPMGQHVKLGDFLSSPTGGVAAAAMPTTKTVTPTKTLSLREIQMQEKETKNKGEKQPLSVSVWGLIQPKPTPLVTVIKEEKELMSR